MVRNSPRTPGFFSRLALRRGTGVLAGSIATLLGSHSASATTYTYSVTTTVTNTSTATPDLWSSGTNWSSAPVSDPTATLSFTGSAIAAGKGIFTQDNFGSPFQLNALSFTVTSTSASGTSPTVTISGASPNDILDFVSNGGTLPTLTINSPTTGVAVTPVFTIGLKLDNTLTLAASTAGSFKGAITGTGGLTKTSLGTITLSGTNTYSGTTTVSAGTLQVTDGVGLSSNSYLSLTGGILQSNGAASFTRSLGTSGTNAFQISNSGFSAFNGQLTVNIGGSGSTLVWGSTLGQNLVGTLNFGTVGSNALTLFQNGIDLNGATRTISVGLGIGGDSTEISGSIINSSGTTSGLSKIGTGILTLSGSNSFNGPVTVTAGFISLTNANGLGNASSITANGGAIRLAGNGMTISKTITVTGQGGGDSTGGLTNSNGTNTWAGSVILGSSGGATGVTGNRIGGTAGVFTISGPISGPSGNSLVVRESSTLILTGSNTYDGQTVVGSGTLQVSQLNSVSGPNHLSASNLGAPTNSTTGTIIFGLSTSTTSLASTLIYTGAGETTDRAFSIGSGTSASGTVAATIDDSSTAGTLKILGNFGVTGLANRSLILQGSTASSVAEYAGVISEGTASGGSLSLIKTGSGTWLLSNTNTYLGTTTLSGGILALNTTRSVNANTIIAAGGGLDNVSGGSMTLSNAFTFSGNFTFGGSNPLTLITPVTLTTVAPTVTVNGASPLTMGGNISGTSGFTKSGAGSLLLTGSNSYTGATTISQGTLALTTGTLGGTAVTVGGATTNGTLNIQGNYTMGTSSTGSLTIKGGNGSTVGQGNLSLVDGFFNTLTLANATGGNTNLTLGGAANNPGAITLEVGGMSTDQIAVGQNLLVNLGGAVINLAQLGTNTLATGSYTLLTFAGVGASTGTFTIGTTPTLSGQVGSYLLSNTGTSEVLTVSYLTESATAFWTGSESNSWNTNDGATNFTVNPDGTGGSVLPDSTTSVTFTGSSINPANNSTLLGANFSIAALEFTGTGTPAASNAFTIGGGNTLTIGAGGLTVDPGSANHTISANVALGADETWTINNSSSGTFTVSGAISGAHQLTVAAGSGALVLNATNTYGATVINSGGTVLIGDTGTLGSGAVTDNGTLIFHPTSSAQVITNSISGNGTLSKISGIGDLGSTTLTGSSTFSGTTLIQGVFQSSTTSTFTSTLSLSNSFALGTSAVQVNSAGMLQLKGNISVSNPVTVNSGGVDTVFLDSFSGTNTFSGPITINNSVTTNVRISSDTGSFFTVTGNVSGGGGAGATLVLQGLGIGDYTGNISGSMAFIKSSASNGTWMLSGSNSFTGATTVGFGLLEIGDGGTTGSLPVNSAITGASPSGTFGVNRSNLVQQGVDFSNTLAGADNFGQVGSGTTVLNSSNTFTGNVFLNNGTLSISTIKNVNGGASSLGAPTTISAGTIFLGSGAGTGTLLYTGPAATTDRVLTLGGTTGGGVVDASGTGLLRFTSSLTATGSGLKTLTLRGSGLGQLDGAIVNSGAATSLAKAGSGTWTLAGSSTYTGSTTVSGGTLSVSGSLSGTTAVIANNSGTFLLSATNGVSKVNTAATVTLGSAGTPGTLAIANSAGTVSQDFTTLTLNANSTIDFGTGNTGTFRFTSTASNGFSLGTNTLTVADWTGSVYDPTTYTTNPNTDHLLTESQFDPTTLANIHFYADSGSGLGTQIDVGGAGEVSFGMNGGNQVYEIVPIPEPSTLYSAMLAVGLVGLRERRRFRRLAVGRK